MGTATGNIIKKLRPAIRSGSQLGLCEECSKPMVEAFVFSSVREYRRDNGELYTGFGGGIYGHADCLKHFGPFNH